MKNGCKIYNNGETHCARRGVPMAPNRYAKGLKYCTICAMMFPAKKFCPCCRRQLRTGPHITKLKDKLRGDNGGFQRF